MGKSTITLRGFFHVKIGEIGKDGKLRVVGDSGLSENTMTNVGLDKGVCAVFAQTTGSQFARSLILGTQTNAVNATQTALSGPGTVAAAWVAANLSTVQTGTFRMTGTLDGQYYGSNVGAIGVASATNGSILSGNTFSGGASSFDTGQTASVTYEWQVA